MRALIKSLGEAALVNTGWSRLRRRGLGRRTMILAYHNVVPDALAGRGDAPLHLPAGRFARHLERLGQVCRVVPLRDVLEPSGPPRDRDRDQRPRVAITFDDAYRGALTLGLDLLARRGMPATVFAAPALLDDRSPWWDALAEPDLGGPDPQLREAILRDGGGEDAARRAAGVGRREPLPAPFRIATAEELVEASRRPGIRVGSHTWSHRNLPALEPAAVRRELAAPREWLRARVGPAYLDVLSFPYGRTGLGGADEARAAGYDAGLTLEGGWLPPPDDPDHRCALPRTNMPAGLSDRGLVLRLSREP